MAIGSKSLRFQVMYNTTCVTNPFRDSPPNPLPALATSANCTGSARIAAYMYSTAQPAVKDPEEKNLERALRVVNSATRGGVSSDTFLHPDTLSTPPSQIESSITRFSVELVDSAAAPAKETITVSINKKVAYIILTASSSLPWWP